MNNEQICEIEFDNFDKNIKSTWHRLQNDTAFSDVTLVCDEKLIEAHKIVLASSSPFFENILRHSSSSQQKPFICLVGMKLCDLEPVMDYMYQGKVNLRKEYLKNFLKVAKQLKIEGLSGDGNEQNLSFESGLSQNLVDVLSSNEERLPSIFNQVNNSQDSEMYNNDIENVITKNSPKGQPTCINDEEMLGSNFNSESNTGNNSVNSLSPKRQKTKFTSDQRNLSINSQNIYHEMNTNEIAASSLIEVTAPFDIYQSNSILEHQNLQSNEDVDYPDFHPNEDVLNKPKPNFNPLFLNANVQETDNNSKKQLVNNHSGSNQIKPRTHYDITKVTATLEKENLALIDNSRPAFTNPKLSMPFESKDHGKIKKEFKSEQSKKNVLDTTHKNPLQSGQISQKKKITAQVFEKVNPKSAVFLCELCNKQFTNYKSVWLHKKITHK